IWKTLGFTMNSILAWFITFNFINIAWVFFRAKEWDDAIKVLKAMFGFSDFMNQYSLHLYQERLHIGAKTLLDTIKGDSFTLKLFVVSFIIIFFLKNNSYYLKNFSLNLRTMFFVSIVMAVNILYLNNMTEFLYFNF
ncbi:MBOAT family protein, partial [Sulfurimonas sp. C5]|nr:MBOAT family protein [Sulfurimonas sp. C5]